MQQDKLEKIEKELQNLKAIVMFGRDSIVERKPVSLRGICRITVPEEELEKAIEEAKKSVFSGMHVLRD